MKCYENLTDPKTTERYTGNISLLKTVYGHERAGAFDTAVTNTVISTTKRVCNIKTNTLTYFLNRM